MTALALLTRSFGQTAWANRRVLAALREQTDPLPQAAHLFAHLLAAEHVWLRRLRGEDAAALPIWPDWDLNTCEEHLTASVEAYHVFLSALSDVRLAEVVTYPNSTGKVFQTSVGDLLQHVLSHGAYHRGQIALLLRQSGQEPVNTDFITFTRG